nr:DUF4082 domain-containing protein [Lutibaculum baratangense]
MPAIGDEAMARDAVAPQTEGAESGAGPVAAAGPNKIVLENQKQGNPESEWGLVDGIGNNNIQGFATEVSVNIGESIDFKIATNSTDYRIDIYRLGYYGGDGARKIDTIQRNLSSPQVQPHPIVDYDIGLIDAGNWDVSASWEVPEDAVSGIYLAKLVRQDGTEGANWIPFVVRDDAAASDIVFQTSDTTWQAYNAWGGASLYYGEVPTNPEDMMSYLPPNCSCGLTAIGRAYAVSFNRPYITTSSPSGGAWDFIFGAEYPALYWLEQNGYDISYISGVDTSRSGEMLLNHKAFLSVGHDEYWSGEQRANVEAARDAGVNLAFWSGNEVYWKVRWETSIDGNGTPYRTMVCYKETWAHTDIDPSDINTGTWRDPRFADPGQEPENSLTGTMFTVDSYRLDTISIPYEMSQFRFWRNTDVANLAPGQTATLVPNLLGYEWDSDVDNGFRPAGLINLSLSTVSVDTYLRDYGTSIGPNVVDHSLTMYRAESGALVFGAGTVYWSWGLSDRHDAEPTPTDPNVQQAMVNMFADMGIQPETLMASLVLATGTTDNSAPTSTITSPLGGTSLVEGQKITITGTAADVGGLVAGVEVSTNGGQTWHKASGRETWSYTWVAQAAGTYTILSRAADDSLNLESPTSSAQVTVNLPDTASLWTLAAQPAQSTVLDRDPVSLGVRFQASTSGQITGIRFYKEFYNIGAHEVSLWTADGQLLGTANSVDETLQGWQVVEFSDPINIASGVQYVAAYHTNGFYSSTSNYFSTSYSSGLLSTPVAAGVYGYGPAGTFPTGVYNNENYWVDVVFSPDEVPSNTPPVAVNDGPFVGQQNQPLTIQGTALTANDSDPNGDPFSITSVSGAVNGIVSLNVQTNTITFTPATGHLGPASFNYTITDAFGGTATATVNLTINAPAPNLDPVAGDDDGFTIASGKTLAVTLPTLLMNDVDGDGDTLSVASVGGAVNGTVAMDVASGTVRFTPTAGYSGAASFTYSISDGRGGTDTGAVSLVVNEEGVGLTLFDDVQGPSGGPSSDGVALELGVKFVASEAGAVTGIRYYKTEGDTGPHSATLWTSAGVALATTTTLANPVASGWQTFSFAAPISLVPGETYVASYHTQGIYSGSANYFTSAVTNGPLTAPSSGASGGNGVYAVGASQFPTSTYQAGNYWVDVVFDRAVNGAPVAVADGPFSGSQDQPLVIAVSTLMANDSDPDGHAFSVTAVGNAQNGTVSLNTATGQVTFTPTAGYAGAAGFSYTITDSLGATAVADVALTINPPAPNVPPSAVDDGGFTGQQDQPIVISATTLLANDTDADGDPLVIQSVGGGVNGVASFDLLSGLVTFTPDAGHAGPASFSYTISDGWGGTDTATVNLTFQASDGVIGLFAPGAAPGSSASSDPGSVELGMRFVSSQSGQITGIRYYKSVQDVGTHTGALWTSTGTLLATGTFTNETASGWQTLTFSDPVSVTAGTTYVASYHSNGRYYADAGYFSTSRSNGPLTAPAGANGVYRYGTGTVFPNASYNSSNYWVDVLFAPSVGNLAPVAADDSGFTTAPGTALVLPASALLINDTDPDGDTLTIISAGGAVNGNVAFDALSNTVTFTPTSGYQGPASFTYTISDGNGGSDTASVSLSVQPAAEAQSVFAASATPAVVTVNDASPVELGMRFQADVAGSITGIRFYKGPNNTGTHEGHLWTATGGLLGAVTFTNETASGWQTALFDTPIAIQADTTYVVSYHSNGYYSATGNFFQSDVERGDLRGLASTAQNGNGVYAYGASGTFPESSFNRTNYYVDVLFVPTLAA